MEANVSLLTNHIATEASQNSLAGDEARKPGHGH